MSVYILLTLSQFVEIIGIKFMCHTLIKQKNKFMYYVLMYILFHHFTNYVSIRTTLIFK